MTAMNLIPAYVREQIAAGKEGLRADLLAIPQAEADGWRVTFRDNSWANPAHFAQRDAVVWQASTGWKRSRLNPSTGRFHPPETFPTVGDALANNTEALMGRRMA